MTRNDANEDRTPDYQWELADPTGRTVGRYAGPWTKFWGGDLPEHCEVWLRLGRTKRGRLCCTGVQVGATDGADEYEVTARNLRDIRLGNLLRFIREGMGGVSGTKLDEPSPLAGFTWGELIGLSAQDLRATRGRKGLAPDELRRTAETYREVVAEGSKQPLAETATRLNRHPSTVWRRLQNAWQRPELEHLKPKEETE
jgi:hypothetical protein